MQYRRKKIAHLFNKIALEYDKWYETPLGSLSDALEKDAVFSLAKVQKGELALDVSCGTGHYVLELARRRAKVIGIDSSRNMLNVAIAKTKENRLEAYFIQASAESLPFHSETFNLATAVLMLEFTNSPETVLKEILRVVKLDGRLIIGFLNRYSLWAFIRRFKAIFKDSIWREATFFDRPSLLRMLSKQRCLKVKSTSAIYFPPINNQRVLNRFKAAEKALKKLFPSLSVFSVIACERIK